MASPLISYPLESDMCNISFFIHCHRFFCYYFRVFPTRSNDMLFPLALDQSSPIYIADEVIYDSFNRSNHHIVHMETTLQILYWRIAIYPKDMSSYILHSTITIKLEIHFLFSKEYKRAVPKVVKKKKRWSCHTEFYNTLFSMHIQS